MNTLQLLRQSRRARLRDSERASNLSWSLLCLGLSLLAFLVPLGVGSSLGLGLGVALAAEPDTPQHALTLLAQNATILSAQAQPQPVTPMGGRTGEAINNDAAGQAPVEKLGLPTTPRPNPATPPATPPAAAQATSPPAPAATPRTNTTRKAPNTSGAASTANTANDRAPLDSKDITRPAPGNPHLFTLNLVDADVEAAIKAIGLLTKRDIIVDPRVKGTMTLQFDHPVTRDVIWSAMLAQLRLQGYALVANEGIYKVVPEPEAKLQTATVNVDGQDKLRGDQIITQLFKLSYANANNLVNVLRPLIAPNNTINADPATNTLVITDYAENLARLGKIISAMDVNASSDTEIVVLKRATASELAPVLERLNGGAGGAAKGAVPGGGASGDVILADNASNALLIRSSNPAQLAQLVSLARKLDDNTSLSDNQLHVVYLKNAEATRLAQTLRAILPTQVNVPGAQPAAAGTGAAATQTVSMPSGGASSPLGGGGVGLPGVLQVHGAYIQAEPELNALIINAPESLYRTLLGAIEKLDVRRPQVYIESLIVELSDNAEHSLGVQWQGVLGAGNTNAIAAGTNFGAGADNLLNLTIAGATGQTTAIGTPGQGLNLALAHKYGAGYGLGALVRLFQSIQGANILSTPNLMTLDNEEAKIVVGQNVPFVTGQYAQTGSTGTVSPFQTIERRDVGLTLRVRPQISEGGQIKLSVYQESSSVQNQSSAAGLITNKRSIDTTVLVQDGQTIALGGLMQDSLDRTVFKVPLLGDIPIVGLLFRSTSQTRNKTNLLVFLRPQVLRTAQDTSALTDARYGTLRRVSVDNALARGLSAEEVPLPAPALPQPGEPLYAPAPTPPGLPPRQP